MTKTIAKKVATEIADMAKKSGCTIIKSWASKWDEPWREAYVAAVKCPMEYADEVMHCCYEYGTDDIVCEDSSDGTKATIYIQSV